MAITIIICIVPVKHIDTTNVDVGISGMVFPRFNSFPRSFTNFINRQKDQKRRGKSEYE